MSFPLNEEEGGGLSMGVRERICASCALTGEVENYQNRAMGLCGGHRL